MFFYTDKYSENIRQEAENQGKMAKIYESLKTKNNPVTSDSSMTDKVKNAFSLPPHGTVSDFFLYFKLFLDFFTFRFQVGTALSWLVFTLIFWGALVSITGDSALVGGNLFSLLVLIILAQLGGNLVDKVRLPPLLGMLVVGVLLRSVPGLDVIGTNIDPKWSSTIR